MQQSGGQLLDPIITAMISQPRIGFRGVFSYPDNSAAPMPYYFRGDMMAKQGMKRPEPERKKNAYPPVPEISGKAKHGHNPAPPLIAGGHGKVWHSASHEENDLAVENMMNDFDMTAADLQDFGRNR